LELKPLERSDLDEIRAALRRDPPQISEHSFTTLYVWRHLKPIRWGRVDGSIVLVASRDEEPRLLGPAVGEFDPADYAGLMQQLGVGWAERVPTCAAERLRDAGFTIEPDRSNFDYVYLRRELAELEGRRFHRQKNLVNRCLNSYDCEYVELDAGMRDEVMDMHDRWCADRDCQGSVGLCAEYGAVRETLAHFDAFGLIGGAVRIDGRIEAYSFAEELAPDTAVVHFEKAMTRFDGLYQVINQWFCAHSLARFRFVNREQDMGISGLRKAKKSYNPHHMVEKYIARLGQQ
jgi:hypothetical protein